jgi:hypothetical protein
MRRPPLPLRLTAAALASTLVLACGEPTSPPLAAEAGPPSLASATVRRFTTTFVQFVTDLSSGLTAVAGISADQLALACAGQPFTFDEVSVVEVTRPDGSRKVTVRGNDLTVLVYPGAVSNPCEFAGVPPLATGTAKVIQTDNDVDASHNRTNSFGLSLVGRAAAAGGGTHYRVRARFRTTISKEGLLVVRTFDFSARPVGR